MPAFTVGVDMGGTKIEAGLVDPSGRVLKTFKIPTEGEKGKEAVLSNIFSCITAVWDRRVKAIGIGVPGATDGNTVYKLPNVPAWKNVGLGAALRKKFRVPVIIENDAKCFALAEAVFGAGCGNDSVLGVIVGTGVGVGVIIDGSIYGGKDNLAGEFGMITYREHNIEHYCTGRFIREEARRLKIRAANPLEVEQLARKGNAAAKKAYLSMGENLGYALSIMINAYNPDAIVLGGGMTKAYDLFRKSMKESLKKNLYYDQPKRTPIFRAVIDRAGVVGASILASRAVSE
ncbi:MAG TPA: ROK family protein [Candidatus Nanoarchaeia archaeon]|nr:ROK family protein [Candidatus Nanoarchaeia archaeon]